MAINQKTELQKNLGMQDPFTDILGQHSAKINLKSALMADRHVLIVGPPGVGKTTLAKNIAKLLPEIEVNDCDYHCSPEKPFCAMCRAGKSKKKKIKGEDLFIRIQGSPDLSVEDLLGDIDPIKALKFGPLSMEAFTPGKIFKANKGVLFFDELNRCPEKLQNALLQVLEERKSTLGSYDVDIPADFIFIATMNTEDSSTEKLSDVLLDRFDVLYMDYPEKLETEKKIVLLKGRKIGYDKKHIIFPENILEKAILFVRLLRENDKLEKVPSVRASLGLYERAQSNAKINRRDAVEWNDVKEAAVSVIAHRIKLKPSMQYLKSPDEFLKEQLDKFIEQYAKDEDIELEKEKGDLA